MTSFEHWTIARHILDNEVWAKKLKACAFDREVWGLTRSYILPACRELKMKPNDEDKTQIVYYVGQLLKREK